MKEINTRRRIRVKSDLRAIHAEIEIVEPSRNSRSTNTSWTTSNQETQNIRTLIKSQPFEQVNAFPRCILPARRISRDSVHESTHVAVRSACERGRLSQRSTRQWRKKHQRAIISGGTFTVTPSILSVARLILSVPRLFLFLSLFLLSHDHKSLTDFAGNNTVVLPSPFDPAILSTLRRVVRCSGLYLQPVETTIREQRLRRTLNETRTHTATCNLFLRPLFRPSIDCQRTINILDACVEVKSFFTLPEHGIAEGYTSQNTVFLRIFDSRSLRDGQLYRFK